MADFPANDPNFTDLVGSQTLAANNHAARHNKVHREVEAIAQRVGTTGDTDPDSHEKKIADLQDSLSTVQGEIFSIFDQLAALGVDINDVVTAYQSADTTLQGNIDVVSTAVSTLAAGVNDGSALGAGSVANNKLALDTKNTNNYYIVIGNILICAGQNNVANAGTTVTFPKAFSGVPMGVATIRDSNNQTAWITNITATTITMKQLYTSSSLAVGWIAIGPA